MLTDHQGTVRDLAGHWVDETFRVEHVRYTAFGVPAIPGGLPGAVRSFYAGRDLDRFTDLYNNRARWYDAGAGRFLSEDPIGFAAGDANLYRYCGNSPTNATDPSGHIVNFIAGLIGAGVGAVIGAGAYVYQYATGDVQDFSLTDLGVYMGGGAAAGAAAGATFGLSLAAGGAVSGWAGLTGTAAAVTTASATLGLTGAAAGVSGGLVVGAGLTASHGGNAGKIVMGGLAGAARGLFYGGVSGAAAGAVLPFAAVAGIGIGGGTLGGGLAVGGSFAVGDAVAQGLGLAVGLQDRYSLSQTIFAGGAGSLLGGYAGYRDPSLAVFASGFRSLLPSRESAVVFDSGSESALAKPSTLRPGPYAVESIPAPEPGQPITAAMRQQINELGHQYGCHTCGSKNPGTPLGNFVVDHQPPTAMNLPGQPQRLYPQCWRCSVRQGGQVRAWQG